MMRNVCSQQSEWGKVMLLLKFYFQVATEEGPKNNGIIEIYKGALSRKGMGANNCVAALMTEKESVLAEVSSASVPL